MKNNQIYFSSIHLFFFFTALKDLSTNLQTLTSSTAKQITDMNSQLNVQKSTITGIAVK